MTRNPVRWFEIYVQDMGRAKRFYESVLGVRLERLDAPTPPGSSGFEMWKFPADQAGFGCSGALVRMGGVPSGGLGTVVYFASDDCAVEEKRVPAAGGTVKRPKMAIGPHGFITLAFDTEGNLFGLHSMK